MPHPFFALPGPIVFGHRGACGECPENTLPSFERALAQGADVLETDVHLTRDGEVVVLHDASLARTTDGNSRVADMRYDELRGYATPHGPVPRLDDLFAAMADWDGVWNLEVKAVKATEPMLHLADHHGLHDRVLVSSFDPAILARARDLAPDVPRAYITSGPVEEDEVRAAKDLGCTWLNAHYDGLGAKAVSDLKGHGLRVGAWTVNEPTLAVALAKRGVDCVITDRRDVLEALGDAEPFV